MKTSDFIKAKKKGRLLTMLTAYDAPTAEILASAGIDMILVGDSVGMVLLGYPSTTQVTMDEMIHHAKAVHRGAPEAFIIGDMPYEAVNQGVSKALKSAQRFISEAGCAAVKIEWSDSCLEITRALLKNKIPVMGHLGLTPQTAQKNGGFRVQAKSAEDAFTLLKRAQEWESLGIFSLLLECVPVNVASKVTKKLKIPVMGIGAGADCDGQVLVFHDIVGLFNKFQPKFVKRYANASVLLRKAVDRYASEVRRGAFPSNAQSFHMDKEEARAFNRRLV